MCQVCKLVADPLSVLRALRDLGRSCHGFSRHKPLPAGSPVRNGLVSDTGVRSERPESHRGARVGMHATRRHGLRPGPASDGHLRRHQPRLRSKGGADSDPITMGWTSGPDTTSFAGTGGGSGCRSAATLSDASVTGDATAGADHGASACLRGTGCGAATATSGAAGSGSAGRRHRVDQRAAPAVPSPGEQVPALAAGLPRSARSRARGPAGSASGTTASVRRYRDGDAAPRFCDQRGACRSRRSMNGRDGNAQVSIAGPRSRTIRRG